MHTGFERQAGSGAGLFKDHHQGAILQGPVSLVCLKLTFNDAGALKHVEQLFAR